MEPIAVLVVEDDEPVRSFLCELLGGLGHKVRASAGGEEALEALGEGAFDAVLLDLEFGGVGGLELLRQAVGRRGAAPVVVLSGPSGAEAAVNALRLGAADYVQKPIEGPELERVLARVLGRARGRTPEPIEERSEPKQLIAISSAMCRARALVERIADTDVPVLLLGESGTGKEVIAREIHARSRRRNAPFIKVNCAALPAELLESELFGHERGAFTGATAEKPGKFELADRGTIFLDEIGEMAIRLQAKLLQVLQDEEFFRVGGKRSVRVDARVVVATNRELEREIALGNFREDLYYRLNVVAIRIAPLRERKEDIPPLVEHFMRKYSQRYQNGLSELPPEVLRAFCEYDWPGNVRELENMVRRLVVLKDPVLVIDELRSSARAPHGPPPLPTAYAGEANEVQGREPNRLAGPFWVPQPPPPPPPMPIEEMSLKDIGKRAAMLAEREAILAMLQRTAWNKRKAARKLRISYKALLYKIKESGIVDPRASADP